MKLLQTMKGPFESILNCSTEPLSIKSARREFRSWQILYQKNFSKNILVSLQFEFEARISSSHFIAWVKHEAVSYGVVLTKKKFALGSNYWQLGPFLSKGKCNNDKVKFTTSLHEIALLQESKGVVWSRCNVGLRLLL